MKCYNLWRLNRSHLPCHFDLGYLNKLDVPCHEDVLCGTCCTCERVTLGQHWIIFQDTLIIKACKNCDNKYFYNPMELDIAQSTPTSCYCKDDNSEWVFFTCTFPSVSCFHCSCLASMEDAVDVLLNVLTNHEHIKMAAMYQEMASVYQEMLDIYMLRSCTSCEVFAGLEGGFLCELCDNNCLNVWMLDNDNDNKAKKRSGNNRVKRSKRSNRVKRVRIGNVE